MIPALLLCLAPLPQDPAIPRPDLLRSSHPSPAERKAQTPAERRVAAATWRLYDPTRTFGPLRIFTAASGFDAKGRALNALAFVEYDGRYLGPLSSETRSAGEPGALASVALETPTRFTALFASEPGKPPTAVEFRIENAPSKSPCLVRASGTVRASMLDGAKWRLTELDGRRPIFPNENVRPSIAFDAKEGRAAGSGGCNRFFGSYEANGEGALRLAPLASTKLACRDPEVARTETAFFRALEGVTRYEIEGETLRLRAGERIVLVFTRAT